MEVLVSLGKKKGVVNDDIFLVAIFSRAQSRVFDDSG